MPHSSSSGARSRLRDVTVKEVSLVGKGDNPPARVVLWKNRDGARRSAGELAKAMYLAGLAKLTEALGHRPSAQVRKELFDEVRQRRRSGEVFDALMRRKDALAESLHSILFFGDEAQDTEALIRESVKQFAAAIDEETADLLTGRIQKADWTHDAPPAVGEFTDALAELIGAVLAPTDHPAGPARTAKEPAMAKTAKEILAGLEEADQAVLKAELEKLATVEAELQKSKAELAKAAPTAEPDPLDGVPAAVRKMIEKERADREAENAQLRKDATELRKAREFEAFEKTLNVEGLAQPRETIAKLLFEVPAQTRDELVKILSAASEAARLGLARPAGSDLGTPSAGGALSKLDAVAAEIRKAQPELSIEQARTEAYSRDPSLYVEAERERMRDAALTRIQ